MTKDELTERALIMLRVLADDDKWPVDVKLVERVISGMISEWVDGVEEEIQSLIKDWEAKMEDDNTLYSLGLRRALDVVKGESSVA
jgi:hypothetical protein